MRKKVLFVVLVVALAGCGEQKYSVWKVGGRPAERVAVEKGLDRAACELVVARLEKKHEEALEHRQVRVDPARVDPSRCCLQPQDTDVSPRSFVTLASQTNHFF